MSSILQSEFVEEARLCDFQLDYSEVERRSAQRQSLMWSFHAFIRTFHVNLAGYVYREQLLSNARMGKLFFSVSLDDLLVYDAGLADVLVNQPYLAICAFESAAVDFVRNFVEGFEKPTKRDPRPIQLLLRGNCLSRPKVLRTERNLGRLVCFNGVISKAHVPHVKPRELVFICRYCQSDVEVEVDSWRMRPNVPVPKCGCLRSVQRHGKPNACSVNVDASVFVDGQNWDVLLRDTSAGTGEIIKVHVDRLLCDRFQTGQRISVAGILCATRSPKSSGYRRSTRRLPGGVVQFYIYACGVFDLLSELPLHNRISPFSKVETILRTLAADPRIYERVVASIAPHIIGQTDVKCAVACLLFGGSRKVTGMSVLRGDSHLLLLGSPGTGKSGILLSVRELADVYVYVNGSGASACGLTAAASRRRESGSFEFEAGAIVRADGGVLCIDELDKMAESSRCVLNEAMEQQTVTVCKGGSTMTLNAQTSVLAAGNSVFGNWDSSAGFANLGLRPELLARFDLVFADFEPPGAVADRMLATRLLEMRESAAQTCAIGDCESIGSAFNTPSADGRWPGAREDTTTELIPHALLRQYISYARRYCHPRITEEAGEYLRHLYLQFRGGQGSLLPTVEAECPATLNIGLRHLSALIRLTEALAKIQLSNSGELRHAHEAVRLFKVSTLCTLQMCHGTSATLYPDSTRDLCLIAEGHLLRRLGVGSTVSVNTVVRTLVREMNFDDKVVRCVLDHLLAKGQLNYRLQRKMIYRVY